MDFSIGDVARLAGLPVKTIRYYADLGLVLEASRTSAGYRRFDQAGLARLELVRTLRDLGLDLATIARVADRHATIEEVADAHTDAIDLHIRQLTLRRAVLRAVARGRSRPEEVQRMTAFARASADESRRIMEDFLTTVFAGHPDNPFAARMRAALPVLHEQPTNEQVDAWIELSGLVGDPAFRERLRQMVTEGERHRSSTGLNDSDQATQRAGQAVIDRAGAAVAAGIAPGSAEARPIVDELAGLFAAAAGRQDTDAYRAELAAQLQMFSDRRVERYWQLIGVVNGWPAKPSLMPAYDWLMAALRAPAS